MATPSSPSHSLRKPNSGDHDQRALFSPPDSEDLPQTNRDRTRYEMDRVAGLLTELYQVLIDMGHLPFDCILRPPHDAVFSRLEESEMIYQGLDPLVAPFLQRIPYINVNVSREQEIFPGSKLIVYGPYGALEDSRDPYLLKAQSPMGFEYIEPWVVPIWGPARPPSGTTVLYDVRSGQIIVWDPAERCRRSRPPRGAYSNLGSYYRDYPTFPAAEYLQGLIGKYRKLELVPWDDGILTPGEPLFPYAQKLYQDRGWPLRFRRGYFRRLRLKFLDWLSSHGDDLDYIVTDKNKDTHFNENVQRIFNDAGIPVKLELFPLSSEEEADRQARNLQRKNKWKVDTLKDNNGNRRSNRLNALQSPIQPAQDKHDTEDFGDESDMEEGDTLGDSPCCVKMPNGRIRNSAARRDKKWKEAESELSELSGSPEPPEVFALDTSSDNLGDDRQRPEEISSSYDASGSDNGPKVGGHHEEENTPEESSDIDDDITKPGQRWKRKPPANQDSKNVSRQKKKPQKLKDEEEEEFTEPKWTSTGSGWSSRLRGSGQSLWKGLPYY